MIRLLVAHISDTHLGYRQYNLEERERDFYRAYETLIEMILEEHVDVLLHTGDLFDSPRPPTAALLKAQESILKLVDNGVQVYAIPGSHDVLKRRGLPPHVLYERLGMKILHHRRPWDSVKLPGGELFIAGLQYIPRHSRDGLLESLRRIEAEASQRSCKKILMLHQSLKEYLPFEYELSTGELPRGFHYYAMGHIHQRVSVRLPWGGLLAYAGSTEVCNRLEYSEYLRNGKGAYLVDLSGDEPTLHRLDLGEVRPHLVARIDYGRFRAEIAKLSSEASRHKLKPVLHLVIVGRVIDRRLVFSELTRLLQPKCLTVRVEFRRPEEAEVLPKMEGPSELDVKKLLYEELKNSRAAELAYRLFQALKTEDLDEALAVAEEFYRSGLF